MSSFFFLHIFKSAIAKYIQYATRGAIKTMGSQVYSCEIAMLLKRCPIRAGRKISTTCFSVLVHIYVPLILHSLLLSTKKYEDFLSFNAKKGGFSHPSYRNDALQ